MICSSRDGIVRARGALPNVLPAKQGWRQVLDPVLEIRTFYGPE